MKKLDKILIGPWAIFAGILAGILLALVSKKLALALSPLGQIYLNLIQMLVMPIMITAVISSFGNLFHNPVRQFSIERFFITMLFGLMAVAVIVILIGIMGRPGSGLSENARLVLGQNIPKLQSLMPAFQETAAGTGFWQFLNGLVPFNIFISIDQGNMLGVLFFCVLLGIGLGKMHTEQAHTAIISLEGVFSALLKIISWVMYGLPFGLCFLFAGYIAKMGFGEIFALGRLIIVFYVAVIILFILNSLVVWRLLGGKYFASLRAFKDPLLIGFGTASSFAAIPSMLESLKALKINKNISEAVVPLGVNLNRQGNIVRLVLGAIFTAQLFSQPLTFSHLVIIFVTSILASIASPGGPGLASLGVAAIVLQPLGLPVAIGVVLLAAITPITDPVITLTNVYGNCVLALLVAKRKHKNLSV